MWPQHRAEQGTAEMAICLYVRLSHRRRSHIQMHRPGALDFVAPYSHIENRAARAALPRCFSLGLRRGHGYEHKGFLWVNIYTDLMQHPVLAFTAARGAATSTGWSTVSVSARPWTHVIVRHDEMITSNVCIIVKR